MVQIRNETAEDFLDLLKEWDKLCKRYTVNDVRYTPDSKSRVLRSSDRDGYSVTNKKIPSEEFEVASLVDICYDEVNDTGKRGLKFKV